LKHSRTKLILSVVVGCFLLLLAVNYMAGELSPTSTALDAALAECRVKGWQENDLAQSGYQVSNSILGSSATITLTPKDLNRPKTVRVQLRKRINLLGWEVVDYKEE
jgi:hypothetical protein